MSDWNARIIEEFRENDGRVGGVFEGATLLLLHHTGRTSGTARIAPLMYRREGDRIFVFGSKGGADTHPDWYLNVMANPSVTYEAGTDVIEAEAAEVTGGERDEIYARQSDDRPIFGEYQRGTERTIPVIELKPRADN